MKMIVETSGDFGYFDAATEANFIEPYRPTVVKPTAATAQWIGNGTLKILVADLPDEADDEEFKQFWLDHDRDADTAIENFKAKFEKAVDVPKVEAESNPTADAKPAPKKRNTRKKAAE